MNDKDLLKLEKNLSEFPGLLGKEEYFNSAVLIPLVKKGNEFHLLFEKRAAKIRQGGEVCFPGGEFDKEKDKDFKETAIRETEEELGISREKIKINGCLGTFIGPMGVTVDAFIAVIDQTDIENINIDKNEVEKIGSVWLENFKCLNNNYFLYLL